MPTFLSTLLLPAALATFLAPAPPPPTPLRDGLAIGGVSRSGRSVIRIDPIEAAIVGGIFAPPADGDKLTGINGETSWAAIKAGDDEWFGGDILARGGYLFTTFDAPEAGVMLLKASGHGIVYVNGEPRAGDPYMAGYVTTPIAVKQGQNTLLFTVGRGRVRAAIAPVEKPLSIDLSDTTTPDVLDGEDTPAGSNLAALVINATDQWQQFQPVSTRGSSSIKGETYRIAPLTVMKPRIPLPAGWKTNTADSTFVVTLNTTSASGEFTKEADRQTITLRRRKPEDSHKRTFISRIDDSAQYYGVVPPSPAAESAAPPVPPALVLSLHGASVEAIGQAEAYSPKSWATIIAPTNRRPFGFDWEDWGRTDAIEVLDDAARRFKTDAQRVYLTGHSMGGHGTWNLGATLPGRFAAIAPSAGWCSFWTYAAGPRPEPKTEPGKFLRDSANTSDTAALVNNFADHGIFILHGDADDNVPVSEARDMRERLRKIGLEPGYHEQPGAGHWWDGPFSGADCVDWPAIFDTFAARRIPALEETRTVRFSTFDPGVSSQRAWAQIISQERSLELSTIDLALDPLSRSLKGTTTNVRRLVLTLKHLRAISDSAPFKLDLDGAEISITNLGKDKTITLEHIGDKWKELADAATPQILTKAPGNSGPFKSGFNNRFILVYSTAGTDEENRWSLSKARLDAETWRVRGNGLATIISDRQYLDDGYSGRARNVILYGHAEMNKAFDTLLKDSPVRITRGSATLGDRSVKADDLACTFVYPSASTGRFVTVIAGTGPAGMRLAERTPHFVSGVGIPDLLIMDPRLLTGGEDGLVVAGFFGPDWKIGTGRWGWRAAE